MAEAKKFNKELESLKIDRGRRRADDGPRWSKWWILLGVFLLFGLGAWRFLSDGGGLEVETTRVEAASAGVSGDPVVLNAAGYIVPHHKIEVASKVVGRVAWIGVEKGDAVKQGQVLVRFEDDEFRARVRQSEGNLAALRARLAELEAGSRPEEIERSRATLAEGKADLARLKLELDRAKELTAAGVVAKQELDRSREQYNAQAARVDSLDRSYELIRIGPRSEEIDAIRGQVEQALGELAFVKTQLDATVIKAPVDGTILERNVEVGEFVTTGFVGDRGAKGYVVSLADLDDIQVELDISQDDFAKLSMGQSATLATDAFRDREYRGEIVEISPEADRQKATVQVKVQILEPDSFLRPEMNANVAFLAPEQTAEQPARKPVIEIPQNAVRDGQVFLLANDKVVARQVETGKTSRGTTTIVSGLSGGEELILNPAPDLEDGAAVRRKGAATP